MRPFGGQDPKMLKMDLLEASWGHLAVNAHSYAFCGQGPKMLKLSLLGVSRGHLAAKTQKCSKWAFWKLPGGIWSRPIPRRILRPRPENIQNERSGCFLGAFGVRGLKIVRMSVLDTSWVYKCFALAQPRADPHSPQTTHPTTSPHLPEEARTRAHKT